jgi:tripartite-type tricarboxylate transporter receptor subunit TctC
MFAGVSAAVPHVRTGKLRALGVSSQGRLKALPDIPTISDAGVKGYEIASWLGVSAPAGTPPRAIARLNAEIVKIVQQPDFAERLAIDGAELQVTSPELFTRYVEAEIQKWGRVIRDSGTKGE